MRFRIFTIGLMTGALLCGGAVELRAQEPAAPILPPKKHLFGSPNSKSKVAKIAPSEETLTESVEPAAEIKPAVVAPDESAAPVSETNNPTGVKPENLQTSVDPNSVFAVKKTESATRATGKLSNPVEIYKIGGGDVLDIKLLNAARQDSSLFTVLENGMLDFPLAGDPIGVAGLTSDEIAELLRQKIKIYENPQIMVAVREFASHKIVLNGMVEKPGTKILRREAVPLYVILAEAGQLPNANKVIIKRAGEPNRVVRLTDLDDETLVYAGDYLHIAFEPIAAAAQFYFIGGVIAFGQKEFHAGLTLTQAILASGGVSGKNQGKATISRQNAEGLLTVTEYNLKEIKQGKVPDPVLAAGDRIEINP